MRIAGATLVCACALITIADIGICEGSHRDNVDWARVNWSNEKQEQNRKQWDMLKKGMPMEDVRIILGSPDQSWAKDSIETWQYPKFGRVMFSEGRVNGWTKPYSWDY